MKHLALAVAAVWLAVMVWIAAWLLTPVAPPLPLPAAVERDGDSAQLAATLEQGRAILDGLAGRRYPLAGQETVIALAPVPAAPASASGAATGPGPAPAAGQRTLSMLYTADGFQRAVIDGQYVAPGQRLADGARVDAIAADHVVLRDRLGRQVLRLAPPLPALNGHAEANGRGAARP